jgi:curved DNA-binding protein CbpA
MKMETLYDILEVSPNASPETVRAAYKSLAQRYHPDRNQDPAATNRTQRINVAYSVLSDPAQRQFYDQQVKGNQEEAVDDPNATAHAANEPPPAPPPSASPAASSDRKPVHPWRRLFAPNVDYCCGAMLFSFGIGFSAGLELFSPRALIALPIIHVFSLLRQAASASSSGSHSVGSAAEPVDSSQFKPFEPETASASPDSFNLRGTWEA